MPTRHGGDFSKIPQHVATLQLAWVEETIKLRHAMNANKQKDRPMAVSLQLWSGVVIRLR